MVVLLGLELIFVYIEANKVIYFGRLCQICTSTVRQQLTNFLEGILKYGFKRRVLKFLNSSFSVT